MRVGNNSAYALSSLNSLPTGILHFLLSADFFQNQPFSIKKKEYHQSGYKLFAADDTRRQRVKTNHYSKTCVKRQLSKRPKIGFQDQLSLNAGQKYCRTLQVLQKMTFIRPLFFIKIFVFSIFEWPFYTFFTVL